MKGSFKKDILIVSFALFSMFFGAGNVIFPPFLGVLSGSDFIYSSIGFIITGAGLPILGVIAIAKAKNFDNFANKVFLSFPSILGTCIMIAIGPLLAIPKTAALTYEIGVKTVFTDANIYISIAIFFIVTLFFSLNSTGVIDKIAYILTPILLLSLVVLIVKGIISPIALPKVATFEQGFARGFVEGYQTLDALASIMFAVVILKTIREKGYESEEMSKITSITGVIAGLGLAVIYFGLVYIGACASEHISPEAGKSEIVIYIAEKILGNYGKLILSSIISLACLTTSIGLTTTAGEYFENMSKARLSYKSVVIFTCIISCIISYMGVDKIVGFSAPILLALYPTSILLIIFNVVSVKNRYIYKFSCIPVLIFSILSVLVSVLFPHDVISYINDKFPFIFDAFAWIAVAIAGGTLGFVVSKIKKYN